MQADFAWVGTVMYEVMRATGRDPHSTWIVCQPRPTPGGGDLASDDFAMAQHHLGLLVQSQAQWDAVQRDAAANGFAIPSHNVNPLVEVCFVSVPGLPHYLEYLFATPMGLDFFDGVPRS